MARTRKADNPALRAEIEQLRRAGQSVNREDVARRHGVSTSIVQVVRSEIDHMISVEGPPLRRRAGGRTVTDFCGRQLRDYRTWARLRQDQLGERAGVSRGEVGHLELGHRKPTLVTLGGLERALGIRAGWLQELPPGEHEANLEDYKAGLEDHARDDGHAREAI